MKKIAVVVLVMMLFGLATVTAGDLFSFTPVAKSPLFQEAVADPYAFQTQLQYMIAPDPDAKPEKLRAIIKEETGAQTSRYVDLGFGDDFLKDDNKTYIHMRTGLSIGFCRLDFSPENFPKVSAELNLGGALNTVFCGFMKNDVLGFDGTYFLGGTVRVADIVSVRFGMHHFSGHYGDELLEKFYNYNNVDFSGAIPTIMYEGTEYYFNGMVEYVRDNSWLAGVSVDLPWGFRVYGEAELPMNPSWLRPLAHVPADYANMVADDNLRPTLIDRIGGYADNGELIEQDQLDAQQELMRTANGAYKAWRFHTGFEWRLDLGPCSVFAAGDVQFHQDGQTLHMLGSYSKDNPWEIEYTVSGGLEFGHVIEGRTVRMEVSWHDGRFPTINWFYSRAKLLTLGFSVS